MKKSRVFLAVCLLAGMVQAQSLGVLQGKVTNSDGQVVPRAVVSAGAQSTLTDQRGKFVLRGLMIGPQEIKVQALGHPDKTEKLEITGGIQEMPPIRLAMPETEEAMVVAGSLLEGQAAALNQQRLAPNIKTIVASDNIGAFPDSNAAEATQRVPGIFTARDQGEGRYVQVRGTEARLNKTTINDIDLPAPEGDLRTVALDVIPLDMLDAIVVSKAVTPDMDGDSVGGTVDLVVKKAPSKARSSVGVEYGYNDLASDDITAADVLLGRRFVGDRLGVIATFSMEDANRATHNFEAEYGDGVPEDLQQRDYLVNRERIGAHLALDYDANERLNFSLNASYAQFDDQEFRRRTRHRLDKERMERELKDRFESQLINSVQLKSTWYSESGNVLTWSLAHSYAHETEPNRLDTTFRQKDIVFDPNFSEGNLDSNNIQPNPLNQDIAAYELDDMAFEDNFTNDEHNAFKVSYEWSSLFGSNNLARFKVGMKYREKEKMRDQEVTIFESSEDVMLADFIDPNYNNSSFLDGRYEMGPMVGANQARQILAELADESEKDFEADAADYHIQEDKLAVYAMTTLEIGDKWTLLPGVRYEQIDADYTGYEVAYDEDGDFAGVTPQDGVKDDDIFMPQFHATYKMEGKRQIRAAFTRTYARARVYDQVPYRLLLREDQEMEVGNPDIDITTVWNMDVMYEHYWGKAGLFSAGMFYKDLTDYIFIMNSETAFDGETYEVTSPQNGDAATLWGMELAYQRNFENGFGLYLNYTYTDSDAKLEDRDITLPGQTESIGNLAFTYEHSGFSVRLSGNLHGEFIYEVGGDADSDIHQDEHFQVDLNASYRFNRLKLFAELVNLNDEKFVYYEGNPQFPIQYEQYKTWGRLGLKFDF